MVLFDDVVEVLDFAHHDGYVAVGVDLITSSPVSAAIVHRDLQGLPFGLIALQEKRIAEDMSHFAVSRKSKVLPRLSTAR